MTVEVCQEILEEEATKEESSAKEIMVDPITELLNPLEQET